jgi:hypothetical protein
LSVSAVDSLSKAPPPVIHRRRRCRQTQRCQFGCRPSCPYEAAQGAMSGVDCRGSLLLTSSPSISASCPRLPRLTWANSVTQLGEADIVHLGAAGGRKITLRRLRSRWIHRVARAR